MAAVQGFRVSWDILYKAGMWSKPCESKMETGRRLFINSLLFPTVYLLVSEIADLIDSTADVARFCFNLCITTLVTLFFVRYLVFWFKVKHIQEFISNFERYYIEKLNEAWLGLELFQQRGTLLEKLLKFVSILGVGGMFGIMMAPLLDKGHREFPVPGRYAKVLFESPFFELWYITVVCMSALVVITMLFGEILFIGFILQLVTQYQVLIDRINNSDMLFSVRTAGKYKKHFKQVSSEEVKTLIKEHQYILSQIKLLNVIYSSNVLVDVILVVLIFCGLGYAFIIVQVEVTVQTLGEACYGMIVLVDLFIQAILAQQLETKSLELADTLWATRWLEMDYATQTNVRFFICKAQRPVMLNLGRFTPVTNQVIVWVLRNSFNLLTLCRELSHLD